MSIARNATYDFASQIGIQAVSVVAGIIIARRFGPDWKGVWQAVLLAASTGTAFANFGSRVANQYIVGKQPARAGQAHGVTILLTLVSSLVCFAVMAWIGPGFLQVRNSDAASHLVLLSRGEQWQLLLLAALVLPMMLYNYGLGGILIGLKRVKELAAFTFYFTALQSVAWIIALLFLPKTDLQHARGNIEALLVIWLLCWIIGTVWLIYLLRDHPPRLTGGWALLRENLRYGLTAFAGNFANNVMQFFDNLIFLPYKKIGQFSIFSTADGYSRKFFMHPEALEKGAFGSVTGTSYSDALRLVCRLVRMSLALGVVVTLGGGIVSSALLWANGRGFLTGILPLWILFVGQIAAGGSRMIAMFYSGQLGKPRVSSIVTWIGAVLNVALVYAGIHLGGMIGVAVGTTLSYIAQFLIFLGLFYFPLRKEGLDIGTLLLLQKQDLPLLKQFMRKFLRKDR